MATDTDITLMLEYDTRPDKETDEENTLIKSRSAL